MKKRLFACLFAVLMALSFVVPVMATEAVATTVVYTPVEQVDPITEIIPFNEQTRIYFRNNGGVLQFRVWSITWGRWITDWTNV